MSENYIRRKNLYYEKAVVSLFLHLVSLFFYYISPDDARLEAVLQFAAIQVSADEDESVQTLLPRGPPRELALGAGSHTHQHVHPLKHISVVRPRDGQDALTAEDVLTLAVAAQVCRM